MSSSPPPGAQRHARNDSGNPLMSGVHPPSPTSSGDGASTSRLRPTVGRVPSDSSAQTTASWVEPSDWDPTSLFQPTAPIRPFSENFPRMRTPSFAGSESSQHAHGPFPSHTRTISALSMGGYTPGDRASTSLSLNYVPTKFSNVLAHGGARRRQRVRDGEIKAPVMARGGGVDAFRSGEARVADDRDDLAPPVARKGWLDRSDPDSSWTRFKWVLFSFNVLYTMVAMTALVICILVWLDILDRSDVLRVANRTALVFSTLAASVALFTSVFGWAGVMMNNRSFLAFYNLFLWFSFAFLVVPGYITYRRSSLNLEGKINQQWSQDFDIDARRRIQNALHCCGYFSPFIEASISSTCYARSILPGCKAPYLHFERRALTSWYTAVFSLAAFHVLLIAAALLCSDHVTYRFGKGMMPERYRLDAGAVAIIVEEYAKQLAEVYGEEVAVEALRTHSRNASMLDLGRMTPMGMHAEEEEERGLLQREKDTRYGTIRGTVPDTAI